jgi:hypothetical protein
MARVPDGHASNVWACDFFCVPTVLFQTLHVFFVIRLANREIFHVVLWRPHHSLGQVVPCAEARPLPRQAYRKIAAEPVLGGLHQVAPHLPRCCMTSFCAPQPGHETVEPGDRLRDALAIGEPTRSVNITVSWRRSASSWRVGLVSLSAAGAAASTDAPPRSRIARSLRRWPSETPRSFRSWSVNSGRTLASMSLSAKRWAHSDMPSFLSQSAIGCIAATQVLSPPDRATYNVELTPISPR